MADDKQPAGGEPAREERTAMGQHTGDALAAAWFLAGLPAPAGDRDEPADELPPNVIISVSLDELDMLA